MLDIGPGGNVSMVTPYIGGQSTHATAFSLASNTMIANIDVMIGNTVAGNEGTAYLMTQIGPGTNATHEIASATVAYPVFPGLQNPTFTTVFSNLTLGPGTYYFVFQSDVQDNSNFLATFTGTSVSTQLGLQFLGDYGYTNLPGYYGPAQQMGAFDSSNYRVRIEGRELPGAATPEPGTLALTLGAGVLIGFGRWKRRSA